MSIATCLPNQFENHDAEEVQVVDPSPIGRGLTRTRRRKNQRKRSKRRKRLAQLTEQERILAKRAKAERRRIRKVAMAFAEASRIAPHRPTCMATVTECPLDVMWPLEIRGTELFRQATELWNAGHYRSAASMARAAVELKLREIAKASPLVDAIPEARLARCIAVLFRAGVIDRQTARALNTTAHVAALAAHGGDVTIEALGEVLHVARTIVHQWPLGATPMCPRRIAYAIADWGEAETFVCLC